MQYYLITLLSAACLLQAGHSLPSYDGDYSGYGSAGHAPVGYHGPLAKTVVLKSGHIADTPEVAAAKHLHYSALEQAKVAAASYGHSGVGYDGYGSDSGDGGSYGSGAGWDTYGSGGYASSYKKYSGPLAYPKVLSSGQLADTHDVAAARHAHLNAVAITASEHAQKWANNYYH